MKTLDTEALAKVLDAKTGAKLLMWMKACASCGLCAKACHFYRSDPRPEHVPAYRLKPLRTILEKKDKAKVEDFEALAAIDYGTCTMCRRCTMYCPFGIDIATLVRVGRSLAVSQGLTPPGLAKGSANAVELGNNIGVTEEEYVETIAWQLEELQEELPTASAPMDRYDSEVLVTFHPRDIKFYPGNLYSYLKIYNSAGVDFTLSSTGWDSTNLGLFSGDDAVAKHMVTQVSMAAKRLKTPKVLTAE